MATRTITIGNTVYNFNNVEDLSTKSLKKVANNLFLKEIESIMGCEIPDVSVELNLLLLNERNEIADSMGY